MRTARTKLLPSALPLALASLALIACAGLASCANTQSIPVAGTGPHAEPWPAVPPRIDISNFNGRVDLVVNERLTAPQVSARAWSARGAKDVRTQSTLDQITPIATLEPGEGGADPAANAQVFRVVVGRQDALPDQVGVDLSIAVPSAGAITIYNRGGPVRIVGAADAVQVENGRGPLDTTSVRRDNWFPESDDPWIQLRTAAPVDQPIALVTDFGNVALIIGPTARGALNIQAPNGTPNARARVGTFDQFHASHGTITARFNAGANPILLRTENGDATALMIERPADFKQRMW